MTHAAGFTHERIADRPIDQWPTLHEYLMFLRHQAAYRLAQNHSTPDSKVLDFGSGTGYGSKIMTGHFQSYQGLDNSPEAIAHANATFGDEAVSFDLVDPEKPLPFKDNTFDLILSFQVIEHVHNVKGYLAEINRLLKKDARALITTPNRLLRCYKFQKPMNEFHLKEYSPKELLKATRPFFNAVNAYGVSASQQIMDVEITRLRKYRNVPRFLKQIRASLINSFLNSRAQGQPAPQNTSSKTPASRQATCPEPDRRGWNSFSESDYFLTENNIESSLDLFFVMTK